MAINGKAFKGTPRGAVQMQPYIAPAHPGSGTGMPWGRDMRTGAVFCLDVHELRKSGDLNGLIMRIDGIRGVGKSAFMKSMALRMLGTQAGLDPQGYPLPLHVRIIDQKPEDGAPEYGVLTQELRTQVIKPVEAGKINPLDASMGDEVSLLELAVNLSETVLNRRLQRHEPLAHQIAVSKMYREYGPESSPEVLEGILRTLDEQDKDLYYQEHDAKLIAKLKERSKLRPELIEQLQAVLERPHNIPMEYLRTDAAQMATSMGQLLRGDFGGIFGNGISMREMLSQQIATIDRTGMNEKATVIFDALMWRWQTWALDHNDQTLIPHLNIGDEEADSYKSLMYLRFYDEFQRKARAYHTWDMRAVQVSSQLAKAGAESSEIRELAKSIDRGVAIRAIGRQPQNDEEILHDITRLGVSDLDAWLCTQLGVGCIGLKIGDQPIRFVQYLLTKRETEIVKSNKAAERMNERANVHAFEHIQQRIQRLADPLSGLKVAEVTDEQAADEAPPTNGTTQKSVSLKKLFGRAR